jgi:hypothetical protein
MTAMTGLYYYYMAFHPHLPCIVRFGPNSRIIMLWFAQRFQDMLKT